MGEFTPINTQEELDKVLASRLQRERDTVTRSFQTQITERDEKITGFESTIADLNKQIETLSGQTGRITELEAKVREYETASVKTRIAHEEGLPYELHSRLTGETEDEIRKDAQSLAKLMKNSSVPPLAGTEKPVKPQDAKMAAYKELLGNLNEK